MKDPWNPKKEDLLTWAYDSKALSPVQDFDLAVADLSLAEVILDLASDDDCPKQRFFLQCAYLIIGDAVRSNYETYRRDEIEQFLSEISKKCHIKLDRLHERAKKLMSNPSSFNYELWCLGLLPWACYYLIPESESIFKYEQNDPDRLACEIYVLMAVRLYKLNRLSSEKAAELAGMSRIEFLANLERYQVFLLEAELQELERDRL